MTNEYIVDAGLFLQNAASKIKASMKKSEVILAAQSFAFGLERILKGILFEINPVYVLVEPKFENSLSIFYKSKLIANKESQKELAKNPNADVLTFKKSLLRAQSVSETTFKYKHTLFFISEVRDIIAHHEIKLLELEKIKTVLQRDFYPIVNDYLNELQNVSKKKYFQEHHIRLAKLSSKLQTNLEEQIKLRLDHHKQIWIQRKNIDNYYESKLKLTKRVLLTPNKFPVTCPSCSNTAVIYSKPIVEVNFTENEAETVGFQVTKIKCHYCKLVIDEPEEIDFLDKNYKVNISNAKELENTYEFMSEEDFEDLIESYIESQVDIMRGK